MVNLCEKLKKRRQWLGEKPFIIVSIYDLAFSWREEERKKTLKNQSVDPFQTNLQQKMALPPKLYFQV